MTYQNFEDENEKCIMISTLNVLFIKSMQSSPCSTCCLFWHVDLVESAYKYINVFDGMTFLDSLLKPQNK